MPWVIAPRFRFDLGVKSGGGKYQMDAIEEGRDEAGAAFTASAGESHAPRLPGRSGPGAGPRAPSVPGATVLGLIAE